MHHAKPTEVPEQFLHQMHKLGIEARHLDRLVQSPERTKRIADAIREVLHADRHEVADPTPIEFEDALLTDVSIPTRTRNALTFSGIHSLGVLALHTRAHVGTIRTIAPETLDELEVVLGEHGLSFLEDLEETRAEKAARYQTPSKEVIQFMGWDVEAS